MAPPKKTQEELHCLAAQLYLDRKVDTTTSQGQLLEQMAARSAQRHGLNAEGERERLRKALQRAFDVRPGSRSCGRGSWLAALTRRVTCNTWGCSRSRAGRC